MFPVTVIVAGEVAPSDSVEGLNWSVPTDGLLTLMLNAAEVPPPGGGLTAVMERLPAVATSDAVKFALTLIELT